VVLDKQAAAFLEALTAGRPGNERIFRRAHLKPAKDKSTERIDGIVVLIMALGPGHVAAGARTPLPAGHPRITKQRRSLRAGQSAPTPSQVAFDRGCQHHRPRYARPAVRSVMLEVQSNPLAICTRAS
jgi:hypothetical protein